MFIEKGQGQRRTASSFNQHVYFKNDVDFQGYKVNEAESRLITDLLQKAEKRVEKKN